MLRLLLTEQRAQNERDHCCNGQEDYEACWCCGVVKDWLKHKFINLADNVRLAGRESSTVRFTCTAPSVSFNTPTLFATLRLPGFVPVRNPFLRLNELDVVRQPKDYSPLYWLVI
jgi:hypothetical protein